MANSFRFDPNLCTGCAACRLACTIENELPFGSAWRRVETFNPSHTPGLPLYHLSLACNHCAEPACMHACPALAYRRDEATGAVLLDSDRCIGCNYCSWACPYDAPVFAPDEGVMTKCTFCNHRLAEGREPACVALCPTGALGFADLDPGEARQPIDGFPQSELGPRIRIEPLRQTRELPTMVEHTIDRPHHVTEPTPTGGISLRTEWSLMLFTWLLSMLVALVAAAATTRLRLPPAGFAAVAALTLALASAHLGRKLRAWRAVLNVRRSWLSREIVSVSTFVATAVFYTSWAPDDTRVGMLAAVVGFGALLCADRVYSVLKLAGSPHLHSAGLLWSGFFLTGIFSHEAWLAGLFGASKVALYLMRKLDRRRRGQTWRPTTSLVRIVTGFGLPLALWNGGTETLWWVAVASAMLGEWVDRGEFYVELERQSPGRSMAHALQSRIARLPTPAIPRA